MSEQLRQARIRAGITVQEIARETRLSRQTIERAERGEAVSEITASRIVNALNKLAGNGYTVESLQILTVSR